MISKGSAFIDCFEEDVMINIDAHKYECLADFFFYFKYLKNSPEMVKVSSWRVFN